MKFIQVYLYTHIHITFHVQRDENSDMVQNCMCYSHRIVILDILDQNFIDTVEYVDN